jgi:hypothetical protein
VGRRARERAAEQHRRTCATRREPAVELADRRRARRLAVGGALPQPLLARDRRDEVDPAVRRVECEHTAGPLAVGEVQVLEVRPERVRPVSPPGHADGRAGADQDDPVREVPGLDEGGAAAGELLLQRHRRAGSAATRSA